jgi:hypothetical protein
VGGKPVTKLDTLLGCRGSGAKSVCLSGQEADDHREREAHHGEMHFGWGANLVDGLGQRQNEFWINHQHSTNSIPAPLATTGDFRLARHTREQVF